MPPKTITVEMGAGVMKGVEDESVGSGGGV